MSEATPSMDTILDTHAANPPDTEPIIVGNTRFHPGVKVNVINAAIERHLRDGPKWRDKFGDGNRPQIEVASAAAIVEAARNYVRCSTDMNLSPYIKENGRYGTKSPWRELREAVAAHDQAQETTVQGKVAHSTLGESE